MASLPTRSTRFRRDRRSSQELWLTALEDSCDRVTPCFCLFSPTAPLRSRRRAARHRLPRRAFAVRENRTWSRSGTFGDTTLATREKERIVVEAQVKGTLAEIEALPRNADFAVVGRGRD